MNSNKNSRWINLSEIDIPERSSQGFESNVLDREVWKEPAREEAPEETDAAMITLTRINSPNNEVAFVRGNQFTIGKSRDADYSVAGNPSISRIHAVIYKKGGHYYLEDKGSLNHTFVDEEMIQGPYQLRDGLVVRFADEDFILNMVEG